MEIKELEEVAKEIAIQTKDSSTRNYDLASLKTGIIIGIAKAQNFTDVAYDVPSKDNGYLDKQVLVKRYTNYDKTEFEYAVTKYTEQGWLLYSNIRAWRPIDLDNIKYILL